MVQMRSDSGNKYFALIVLAMSQGLRNYRVIIGLSLLLLSCLLIFANLWQLVGTKEGEPLFSPTNLLWYIALNEWIILSIPDIQNDMEEELRSGRLAYLLPRPISYLGSKFAEGLGTLFLYLCTLGPIAFVFTWLWTGVIPFSSSCLCVIAILGLLAGVVCLIFRMLIGISAFWLQEVTPVNWIWEKFLFMLGGLILPLSTYPLWIQTLAKWTPFPAILGLRSHSALEFNLLEAFWISLILIGWGIVGLCFLFFAYRKGLRIVNIQGG